MASEPFVKSTSRAWLSLSQQRHGLPHLAAHTLWPSSPLAHGQHAGGPPEPPVCPCQVAKDTKKAGDKAKKLLNQIYNYCTMIA